MISNMARMLEHNYIQHIEEMTFWNLSSLTYLWVNDIGRLIGRWIFRDTDRETNNVSNLEK